MKKTAIRQVLADKLLLGLATLYAVITTAAFLLGAFTAAVVWLAVYLVALGVIGYGMYRWNLDGLRHQGQRDAERHERDLEMERLAQESDIIRGGGEEAEVIRARWELERLERDQREREARQARIAAYESQRLTTS